MTALYLLRSLDSGALSPPFPHCNQFSLSEPSLLALPLALSPPCSFAAYIADNGSQELFFEFSIYLWYKPRGYIDEGIKDWEGKF